MRGRCGTTLAMGAIPSAFLMTLGVPQSWKLAKLKKFLNGVFCLAKSAQTVCIGGDISSARQFFCSITILGKPSRAGAILRKGAKAGDFVFVTGSFGGSIRHKHYAFTPRVKEAQWLAQNCRPSAMLDVSDGLAQDLTHLLTASHVCARLDLETIPLSVQAGNLSSALSDGEDFELLFTVSSKQAPRLEKSWKRAFPRVALTCIGRIIPGKPQIRFFKNGIEQKKFYSKPGFRHF